jgi:hypothetical protein
VRLLARLECGGDLSTGVSSGGPREGKTTREEAVELMVVGESVVGDSR